jgi:murein DD-endopeptidase / murein LD-carboxypeptidase
LPDFEQTGTIMVSENMVGGARWPAIVAAVRACVGTRFRSQGRTPGLGLDCVGVALVAAGAAGMSGIRVPAYALGGDHEARMTDFLAGVGCLPVVDAEAGDMLVIAPSQRLRHIAVMTPFGVVHAHAGLGRVVEGPIDRDWAVLGAWRLPGAR